MSQITRYISHDDLLILLILRTIGITEKLQAQLLRMKTLKLREIINNDFFEAYRLYLRNYYPIDYCYCLNNSMTISRKDIQDLVISSLLYNCSLYILLMHLQNYISSIPDSYKPKIGLHIPLFRDITHFSLLWKGSFPIIPL